MTYNVGEKIPVWWNTFEQDEKGNNIATILEIRDYVGPLDFCEKILKLTAPGTKRGWLEMTVTK
jgi:hypothetical protein